MKQGEQGSGDTEAAILPGVLIAEDEPGIRRLLELTLARAGLAVWSASDGREAVEVFHRHREHIALVLLDVRMPRLDGPAALAELRRLEPTLVALFVTGYMGVHETNGLLAQEVAAVLRKP